jgi:D-glycerate 3-kinase
MLKPGSKAATCPTVLPDMVLALIADEGLSEDYRYVVDRALRPLAEWLARRHRAVRRPMLVGINGAQGTGKTTLCRFLCKLLLPELGLAAVTLALDDLYLPLADRERLARDVHPLLRTRGVPGTHDVAMGEALIDALLDGRMPVRLPRFDKSRDDRMKADSGPLIERAPDIILFEGWCVGAEPQEDAALLVPVNALEAEEDADGAWRTFVNAALAGPYRALFARIDLLIFLRPPDFDSIIANRQLQEDKLRARGDAGDRVLDDIQLLRFIRHYERLTRHMLATLPGKADAVIDFDRARQVSNMVLKGN